MADRINSTHPISNEPQAQRSHGAAAERAADAVEHPKTRAARKRATRPLPSEVVLLTTSETARALGISAITVWRYTKAGLLPFVKLGVTADDKALRRYRARDIANFIESRMVKRANATE